MPQPAILSIVQSLLNGVCGNRIDSSLLCRLSECSQRYEDLKSQVRQEVSNLFAWGGMTFLNAVAAGNFCSEMFTILMAGTAAATISSAHAITEHVQNQRDAIRFLEFLSGVCREGLASRAAGDYELRDALLAEGNAYATLAMPNPEYRFTSDGMECIAETSEDCS